MDDGFVHDPALRHGHVDLHGSGHERHEQERLRAERQVNTRAPSDTFTDTLRIAC